MVLDSADPKHQAGSKKAPLHLIPTIGLIPVSYVMQLGASKYGAFNWRTGDKKLLTTYLAAIMRHLIQKMNGEDIDSETGVDHLASIVSTSLIILDMEATSMLNDDRPTNMPAIIEMQKPPTI